MRAYTKIIINIHSREVGQLVALTFEEVDNAITGDDNYKCSEEY